MGVVTRFLSSCKTGNGVYTARTAIDGNAKGQDSQI